jgi:cubilin
MVNFTDFDVEPHRNCTYDYVAVYDGPNTTYPQLGQYCGSNIPQDNPFKATSNEVTVRLVTDGSLSGRGFAASYSAVSFLLHIKGIQRCSDTVVEMGGA